MNADYRRRQRRRRGRGSARHRRSSRHRRRSRLLARALPGPEGHPRLGPRVRRRTSSAPPPHEWDEREETPWPVIQEAAKIGLYGFEGIAQFFADPVGPATSDRQRGAFLGRRRASACRSWARRSRWPRSSARARPSRWASGFRSASARESDPEVAAFCASEPDAGSDVSAIRTAAKYDEAKRRVGDQRPEGMGDQRRHRQGPRRHRLGRPRARLARPCRVRHPSRHEGLRAGREGQEARPARLAHRRRPPRRLPCARLMSARRQGEARRAPRPRPRGQEVQVAGRDADLRGLAPDRRRPGRRHRPRRIRVALDYAKERDQFGKADHREPGDRLHPREHEDGDRRLPSAGLARLLDGQARARGSRTPRARCRSSSPARPLSG